MIDTTAASGIPEAEQRDYIVRWYLFDVQYFSLDMFESAAMGAIVLVLGILLVRHFRLFRRYYIPSAVVGGILFSVLMLILRETAEVEIEFDGTVKDLCMNLFFCSIGFAASLSMMKSGGRILLLVTALVGVLIVLQDAVGMACAVMFGLEPGYGLAMGSISLIGGLGTSAAYGPILVNEHGLVGADVIAVACATIGLASAGFIGGPLARRLIKKNDLKSFEKDRKEVYREKKVLDNEALLHAMILLVICVGAGVVMNQGFLSVGLSFPAYFGGLILAVAVRNIADMKGWSLPVKEIEVLGWLALCLFLSMALMSIQLWQISGLAGAMIATLLIQLAILVLFVYFVAFRVTGGDYESAAISSGIIGFGIGATPNAVANVEAIKKEHGPAPVATFVIPLVGGIFLDIMNATVLTILINLI